MEGFSACAGSDRGRQRPLAQLAQLARATRGTNGKAGEKTAPANKPPLEKLLGRVRLGVTH